MNPPARGNVRLYSAIRPALTAGRYTLKMAQTLTLGPPEPEPPEPPPETRSLPTTEQSLHLVAPRHRMAGSELYSLFPPPNAQGPFTNRFAQAVLKRRTLPWERHAGSGADGRRTPWMALVVLAEGEGTLLPDRALTDAVLSDYRAGIQMTPAAASQAGSCDVLQVTGRVVRKAFPSLRDLPYLAHVREVNLLDSEDANLQDDDGFVAVVASNRVLRGGQHYGAYLISVEGQLGALPDPSVTDDGDHGGHTTDEVGPVQVGRLPLYRFVESTVWSDATVAVDAATGRRGGDTIAGRKVSVGAVGGDSRARFTDWALVDQALATGNVARASEELTRLEGLGLTAEVAGQVTEAVANDFQPGDLTLRRFPVLAHWSFDTLLHGDFETLLRNVDVGLLGTVGDDVEDPPTVLATGHNLLDRHARDGEHTAGWYRGPLVPHELADRDDVPLHAAEQAIRVGSDGIEDLSYAAAFELGRLLALADPRFVSALVQWRRNGSTVAWAGLRRDQVVLDLLPPLELDRLAQHLGLGVVEHLLGHGGRVDVLGSDGGPLGPLVNPVPLRETYDVAADVGLLEGIGLSRGVAEATLGLAPDAPFGAAVDGVGLDVDAGVRGGLNEVTDLVGGAYGDALRAALDAAFVRDVGRSGAQPGGGG